jgi:hypothetical protein
MIFRRRRTRIEIEHTTVRVEGGGLNSVVLRPVGLTPAAPSPGSVLARALAFPVRDTAQPNSTPSVTTINPPPAAKESRS